MKKVMFMIVGMFLSLNVSAATMSWVSAPVIDKDNSSVQITAHEGYAADEGIHVDEFKFNVDEAMSVAAVAIEFYSDQLDISNVTLDGLAFSFAEVGGGLAQWTIGSTLLAAGDHIIALYVTKALDGAQLSVKVSAVPVPAALFLFAPALLGFFGLRRKAAVAA